MSGDFESRDASGVIVREADDYSSSSPVDVAQTTSLVERARALALSRGTAAPLSRGTAARTMMATVAPAHVGATRPSLSMSGAKRTLSSSLTARSHGVLATVRDRSRTITSTSVSRDLASSGNRTMALGDAMADEYTAE